MRMHAIEQYHTYRQEKDEESLRFFVFFLDKHCFSGHKSI